MSAHVPTFPAATCCAIMPAPEHGSSARGADDHGALMGVSAPEHDDHISAAALHTDSEPVEKEAPKPAQATEISERVSELEKKANACHCGRADTTKQRTLTWQRVHTAVRAPLVRKDALEMETASRWQLTLEQKSHCPRAQRHGALHVAPSLNKHTQPGRRVRHSQRKN
ncbi:MAG: hypothetical protein EOO65_00710 [Methanosarcinales archaeon]|nr:MAG: hypothetical protein EOO65_00710 [Methanosarcinales archaeon]